MDQQTRKTLHEAKLFHERQLDRNVKELHRIHGLLGRDITQVCWTCPNHNIGSTNLSACERANVNYPEPCPNMPQDNWKLYLEAAESLKNMVKGL